MNQTKCINDVLNRYSDFPTIQADMRKLLKYTESQFRMFLKPIIKDEPPRTINSINDEIDAITDPFTGDSEAEKALSAVAIATTRAILDPTDRPANLQKLTTTLASLKDRPDVAKAASEVVAVMLNAMAHDAGVLDA